MIFLALFAFFAVGLSRAQRRETAETRAADRRRLVFVGWGLLGLGLAVYGAVSGGTGIATVGALLAAVNALAWWYFRR